MTIAPIAHTKFKGAVNGGTTPAIDTTGANLIVINITPNHIGGPSAPTDSKGNVWTEIIDKDDLQAHSILYFCFDPIVGTGHTFSTTSGISNFEGCCVAAFSGASANPLNLSVGNDCRPPNEPSPFDGKLSPDGQDGGLEPGADNSLVVVGFAGSIRAVDADGFSINLDYTILDSYFQEGFTCLAGGLAYKIQNHAKKENPEITAENWVARGSNGSMCATMATFFAEAPPFPPPPTEGGDDDVSHIRVPPVPPVRQLRTFEEQPFAEYRVRKVARSEFPIRFKVMEQADLRVQIDDVELTQDDFSFEGNVVAYPGYDDSALVQNDNNPFPGFKGGKLTLVGTVTNCIVRIWSDPAPARETDYASGEVQMAQANRATETLWVRNRAQHLKLERNNDGVTGDGTIEAILIVDDVETPLTPSGTLEAASVGLHVDLKGPVLATAFAGDMIYDGASSGTTFASQAGTAQLVSPKTGIWYVARKSGDWALT